MGNGAAKASVPGVVLSKREKGWLSQSHPVFTPKGPAMKNVYIRRGLISTLAAFATLISPLCAAPVVSFDDITYWVGSGSNRAALVIDWNDGTSVESYAWGFRWNGTATGEDMLRAIAGFIGTDSTPATPDGTGDTALTLYTQTFAGFGVAVFQLDYLAHAQGGFEPDAEGYWAYYVGDDSGTLPSEWSFSDLGMGDRVLSNNDWDGWSWAPDFEGEAPGVPVAAAIPEPGTILLFALGVSALLCYRRGRNA